MDKSVGRKQLRGEHLESRLLLAADVRFHPGPGGPEFLTGLIAGEDHVYFSQGLVYEDAFAIDIETGEQHSFSSARNIFLEHTVGDKLYYVWSLNYNLLSEYDPATDTVTTLAPQDSVFDVEDSGYFYSPPAFNGDPTRFVWTDFSSGQTVESSTPLLSSVQGVTIAETGIYFTATHQTRGQELFRFDMETGEIAIYDVNPAGSSSPGFSLTVIGDDAFFVAEDDVHGRELRRASANGDLTTFDTNGTSEPSFDFRSVQAIDNRLWFTGFDTSGENGSELHRVDGDSITTFDLVEGPGSSLPESLTALGDDLYFIANDDDAVRQLWRMDGATDTAAPIPTGLQFHPSQTPITGHETDLYFAASRPDVGEELFRLDTVTDSLDVLDLNPGTAGSDPGRLGGLVVAKDWLFLGTTTNLHGERRITSVPLDFQRFSCDLSGDGVCDGDDIDALMAGLANGTYDPAFDLNGDGVLDVADRDLWLSEAGRKNLGPGRSYLSGDANLDGVVDVSDFNIWNSSRLTTESRWTRGNFNGDGVVDVSDFNEWNTHKFSAGGNLVTLSNRDFTGRYVTESGDHGVFQDATIAVSGEWFIHTTATGVTTLQNRDSGRFLTAEDFEVSTTALVDVSRPSPNESWIMVDNADGTVAFQNLATGRFLDGDGESEGWDVDESLEIMFDDGWFVTPVGNASTLQVATAAPVQFSGTEFASMEDRRATVRSTNRTSLVERIFSGDEDQHDRE